MNKLKIYREYIILAVIAALLVLYIIFRSAGNINYILPEPAVLDGESISGITIQGAEVNLEFIKTDGQWYIEPEGWHADNSLLNPIVKALADVKIADLISTSGNPAFYDLNEGNRILVKAYSGNETVRELFVGKVSSTGIYTYMMFPGDDNIYSIRGDLPSRVSDRDSMRDKKFLNINRNSVIRMTLNTAVTKPVALTKNSDGIWISDSFEADDSAVKAAVNMLDPLRCKSFLYETPADSPEWTVIIYTDEGEEKLEIWPESNELYPARCSQNGYFVNATPYAVEKLLGAFGVVFSD